MSYESHTCELHDLWQGACYSFVLVLHPGCYSVACFWI
jgi:hypothetical protein